MINFSLADLLPAELDLKVVDVGASPIDGDPPWASLRGRPGVRIVGFEPDRIQHQRLLDSALPGEVWLPDAVGDGSRGILKVCRSPGMTSLLEPDQDILQHFHGFPRWAEVVERIPMQTRRLDDVPEVEGLHYLKIDVQGGELGVLEGARRRLAGALMVHLEVQFVPFYKDQPLFAELDQALREAGYWLHTFTPIHTRVLRPLVVNQDPYAGLNQALWSDAVYVRRFNELSRLDPADLRRLAWLAHDLYRSIDLAALALHTADAALGTGLHDAYMGRMIGARAA